MTPSGWQPEGRSRASGPCPQGAGRRWVLYDDAVTPLYLLCARNVPRAATDAVADGVFTATEATSVVVPSGARQFRLITDWSGGHVDVRPTRPGWGRPCRGVGRSGHRLEEHRRDPSGHGYRYQRSLARVSQAGDRAPKELTDLVLATLSRPVLTRDRDHEPGARRQTPRGSGVPEAVRRVFERHQHRESRTGPGAGGTSPTPPRSSPQVREPASASRLRERHGSVVRRVGREVADGSTRDVQGGGSRDIRPSPSLSTMPGGATECGSRCRCVLVFHLGERGQVPRPSASVQSADPAALPMSVAGCLCRQDLRVSDRVIPPPQIRRRSNARRDPRHSVEGRCRRSVLVSIKIEFGANVCAAPSRSAGRGWTSLALSATSPQTRAEGDPEMEPAADNAAEPYIEFTLTGTASSTSVDAYGTEMSRRAWTTWPRSSRRCRGLRGPWLPPGRAWSGIAIGITTKGEVADATVAGGRSKEPGAVCTVEMHFSADADRRRPSRTRWSRQRMEKAGHRPVHRRLVRAA